ncbi:MAG: toll/interleukin-1 receptor domain-containing protein, partial [Candidatus Omnitrophica bacterium]|nr:toll/interleukin-1 receptor domain-containing protein [Candidatus Omnitrophota bacterium]
MKAFLSYSHSDKNLIDEVAKLLGRQFCIFDTYAFKNGDDFKDSIKECLDESSIFVLFASRESLKSIWVKTEIEEAWIRKLSGFLSKAMVFIIDSKIDFKDLPDWLLKSKIAILSNPKAIERNIRRCLEEATRSRQNPFFIGRNEDIEKLENMLTPTDGSNPPHVFFISGLPGIGRKSLTRQISEKLLRFKIQIDDISLTESDNIYDLCLKIADKIEPYSNSDELRLINNDIRSLSENDVKGRIIRDLEDLSKNQELIIISDSGGLINDLGYIAEWFNDLIKDIERNKKTYIALVSTRRPRTRNQNYVPILLIQPLNSSDSKKLLSVHAKQIDINLTPEQINELSDYIAGYPPAAYFVISQAKKYGIELIIQDKVSLVQFRTNSFFKYISEKSLDDLEKQILGLLAAYSPIPFKVINETLEADLRETHKIIIGLIDSAFIRVDSQGFYSIS